MSLFQAILLAVIEGLTEFLPVSSTGHMIIGSALMNIASDPFVKTFTIAIQFGAILSVVVLYWKRFWQTWQFYLVLLAGFMPAAVIGFFLDDFIDALLERVDVVGWMLIAGGAILLFIDRLFKTEETGKTVVGYRDAIRIGLFQCIAMVPGVSRSAATIIGGLAQGLTRRSAAEFSFLLAIPTMLAATAYKLLKFYQSGHSFGQDEMVALAVGNVVAFVVAMLAIKYFIQFLTRHGFRLFGYYRIVVGLLILILYYFGADIAVI